MTECSELLAKLNAIEAKLNGLDDKYLRKSERPGIVSEGASKGKALAMAAILPLLGAFITKPEAIAQFNRAYNKALDAEDLANLANREVGQLRALAREALSEAKGAKGLARQVSKRVDQLASAFQALSRKIDDIFKALSGRIQRALNIALDALGISKNARSVAGRALGVALQALGKIFLILDIISTILSLLNAIDLRRRMNALERRMTTVEREVSRILSFLQRIVSRLNRVEGLASEANRIAKAAQSLARTAQSTATQARSVANSALSQALIAVAQIAVVSGVAYGAQGLAGRAMGTANQALSRARVPGPRGLPGKNGLAGKNGLNGKNGRNGLNGRNGAPGKPITIIQRLTTPGKTTVIDRSKTTVINRTQNVMNPADLALLRKIDATTTATRSTQAAHVGISARTSAVVAESRAFLTTMQNFAAKAWEATRIQKVLDVLTFVGVMHNVSMLSRNVGETFLEVVGQGIQSLGIRDEEGNVIDVNEVVGNNVEGLLQNLLGVERYNGINEAWNKANRIIMSASAIIWTIRSISDASQDLMEWISEHTGKIGNALKRYRVVGENAYPDMSERAKAQHRMRSRFSKAGEFLDATEDRLSVYGQATSSVIEIQQETNELVENFGQFKDSVVDGIPDPWANNVPVQTVNAQDKAASLAPEIEVTDSQQG